MAWAKFDDGFPQHPKVIGLSDAAFRLHVAALCYASRNLTDGTVHRSALAFLTQRGPAGAIRRADELVAAGLWEPAADGCYAIHDYLDYNPSAKQVNDKRNSKAIAGAMGAASRWHDRGNAPGPTRPDPLAAAAAARTREEVSPEQQRAYNAWEQQSPGGLNPVTVAFLDELVEEGITSEWIEAACNVAKVEGGYKSPKFVTRVLERYKRQGNCEDDDGPQRRAEVGGRAGARGGRGGRTQPAQSGGGTEPDPW